MDSEIRSLLLGVQQGSLSVDEALLRLKQKPFEDIGYAKVDLHRRVRQGAGEVVYGAGKTAGQIAGILKALEQGGQENVLITRMDADKASVVARVLPELIYHPEARIGILGPMPQPSGNG